jgi:hypothetical protein
MTEMRGAKRKGKDEKHSLFDLPPPLSGNFFEQKRKKKK